MIFNDENVSILRQSPNITDITSLGEHGAGSPGKFWNLDHIKSLETLIFLSNFRKFNQNLI